MLILLAWGLMLLTLTPAWFFHPDKSLLHTAGIIILLASILSQAVSGRLPRITVRQFTSAISLTLMYLSHAGLVTNYVIYLMLLPWLVLPLIQQVDKAAVVLFWLAAPAIVLQGLQTGYEVYDNSDKTTLLFWNPNIFWHHLSALAAVILLLQPHRWLSLSVGFVGGCLLFGFSRGAALIFGITVLFAMVRSWPRWVSVLRTVPLIVLVCIVGLMLIDVQSLGSLLSNYDELASGRFASVFGGPDMNDIARGVGYATDIPLLDIFLWGYSPLFLIAMVLLAWAVYPRTEAPLIVLIGFAVDSAIYAPVISYLYIAFVTLAAQQSSRDKATPSVTHLVTQGEPG